MRNVESSLVNRMIKTMMMLALSLVFTSSVAADEALFQSALAGHKQYCQQLMMGSHFRFVRTNTLIDSGVSTPNSTIEVTWWQSGDDIRSTEVATTDSGQLKGRSRKRDYARKGQQSVRVNHPTNEQKASALISRADDPAWTPWLCAGLVSSTSPSAVWLHEQLAQPGRLVKCEWDVADKSVIVVEKIVDKKTYVAKFDSAKGFCLIDVTIYTGESSRPSLPHSSVTNVDLVATTEGQLYFPRRSHTRHVAGDGKVYAEADTTFSHVSTGVRVKPEMFELAIPVGSTVVDRNRDSVYRAGKQAEPDTTKPQYKLSELTALRDAAAPQADLDETPRAFPYRWIALGVAGLFFVAAVVLRVRRSRST